MTHKLPVLVKIPFCHGQHRFKIFKGQRWEAVDHLLLQEVVKAPRSALQLSDASGLPRRLIIEIMIPFMRVGWIQISQQGMSYAFQATDTGTAVSSNEELPVVKEPMFSFRQFIIDPITGGCYRVGGKQQSFQIYSQRRANELVSEKKERLIELLFSKPHSDPELSDIFECVTETDEDIFGYEEYAFQRPYSHTVKYVIAAVDEENNISGVPTEISKLLCEQILKAANKKREQIQLLKDVTFSPSASKYNIKVATKTYPVHSLAPGEYELVLGASAHEDHLINSINNAHTRLVIHSTFINPTNLKKIYDALISAAKRSVQIDILWGQVEPELARQKKAYQTTISELQVLNDEIRKLGLAEIFIFHTDPTGSHAKIIIRDDASGSFFATVGSCNWLASGFNRFEGSVMLCQVNVVQEIMGIVSQLAKGLTKISNNLSRELAILSNHLKRQSRVSATPTNTELSQVQIVLKGEHHAFLRKARDEAKDNIFVCSHRISHVSERPIIEPLKASVGQSKDIQAKIFYGVTSGGMCREEVTKLAESIESLGISLEKIDHPTIHAKLLAWDSDNVILTSLNWLSASAVGEDYDEIGIYLKDENVAHVITNQFYKTIKIDASSAIR